MWSEAASHPPGLKADAIALRRARKTIGEIAAAKKSQLGQFGIS